MKVEMNKATKVIVTTLGIIFGLSGISHGFFETLQGNSPTNGMFISAIGINQRMWLHGAEPAFTIIPNYLITGIAAMLVGLAVIVWSLGFIYKKNGSTVLLLLFILLLFVGGGIAQILFFPWIWLVSTLINKPLTWWGKVLSNKFQIRVNKLWKLFLITNSILLIFVLEVAVTGYIPGIHDPEVVLSVMLSFLAAVVVLLPLTFISGFSYDILAKRTIASKV